MTHDVHAKPFVRHCTWPSKAQVDHNSLASIALHMLTCSLAAGTCSASGWPDTMLGPVQIAEAATQLDGKLPADRSSTPAAAVQVPYRVCPLGAHVDHQASIRINTDSYLGIPGSRVCCAFTPT
jgi:hypothetical protein